MNRATVMATGAFVTLLGASGVGWAAQGPGKCIAQTRLARKQCVEGCNATAKSDFVACFGPGSQCAQTCLTADASCKSRPLQAVNACANDPTNPQSCRSKLQHALQACKSDPDPAACADKARLLGLECRQACLDAQKPALDECQGAFRLCVGSCVGVTTTTTTPSSTTTTTTLGH